MQYTPNQSEIEMAFPAPDLLCVAGRGRYTYSSPDDAEMSYTLEFQHDETIGDWMSTIRVSRATGEGTYFASLHGSFADAYVSAFKHISIESGSNYIFQDDPRTGKTIIAFDDFKKAFAIEPPNEGAFLEQTRPADQAQFQAVMPPTR